ncbi:hypothetical protein PFICI_14566 [Pestalotiopsis fici W106-1]|uniref:Uncharacterized protein n=1 Tax=Pestalotiopsis fici (strain W106-1 / CGMCC3.15140) TaxID=1229662 RepID=W3WI61_PESFW|nr:uncharacterized protein PFICI_14566 [Pestalotiopsis fici W106-1]ETS73620.1 hypothetical protein PFICI_14566 [Pestalotiopsis fici W106-1]
MENSQPVSSSLYVYTPDKGAPIFFAAAFAISALGHIFQCFHHQSWRLMGLYAISAIILTAGYAFRSYGAFFYSITSHGLALYTLSQLLIHISPPLHALANYYVLSRVFGYIPHLAPFSSRKILAVCGGITAFIELLCILGVALAADRTSPPDQQSAGKGLIIAAVALQLTVIVFFYILSGYFRRQITMDKITSPAAITPMVVLYISTLLLLIRGAYRLVDAIADTYTHRDDFGFVQESSPMMRYEWIFYVFEATLILANSAIWNIWHPGRYLPKDHQTHLAPDGKTEVQGVEQPDHRSMATKVGHILTFGAFFGRKDGPLDGEGEAIALNEMAR